MGKITATKGTSKPREKVTEGSHDAMLIRVIDLGTQTPPVGSLYPDPKRQIELVYEILDQTLEVNGEKKPMWVFEKISPYVSESKHTNYHKKLNQLSSKTLSNEEAEAFDFGPLLGGIYSVGIVYNKEWENISSVTKASPKLAELYKDYVSTNDSFFFSLEAYDEEIYNKLSDRKRDVISMSPEFQAIMNKDVDDTKFGDDALANLPF